MSGVIDSSGTQWEHCNGCGEFVRIDRLGYMKPTPGNPHGLDLCVNCVDTALRLRIIAFTDVLPGSGWQRTV